MKKTINIIALIIGVSFFFTGCYTIVWDPKEEFPDTENSSSEGSGFYETDYYGGYVDYYETPWWISIPVYVTYPGETDNSNTKNRNNGRSSDTENIRNSNGRGNTDRNSGTSNDNTTTTTNSGNSTNSGVINTPPPTRDSNSESTSSTSSSNSTSNTRNSGSNETRNSSGSRNSGSGRK